MNLVVLEGRLTRDPEVRGTATKLSIAVNRNYKNKETGNYDADFPSVTLFGSRGEFVQKYFHKGDGILIRGSISTGRYEKNGNTVFTTDVIADEVSFPVSNRRSGDSAPKKDEPVPEDMKQFVNVPDTNEEELPWQ